MPTFSNTENYTHATPSSHTHPHPTTHSHTLYDMFVPWQRLRCKENFIPTSTQSVSPTNQPRHRPNTHPTRKKCFYHDKIYISRFVHRSLTLVASLMSLMASLVTTSLMQQCFNVLIDIYHGFLLLFYCVLLEIKPTTTTTTTTTTTITTTTTTTTHHHHHNHHHHPLHSPQPNIPTPTHPPIPHSYTQPKDVFIHDKIYIHTNLRPPHLHLQIHPHKNTPRTHSLTPHTQPPIHHTQNPPTS